MRPWPKENEAADAIKRNCFAQANKLGKQALFLAGDCDEATVELLMHHDALIETNLQLNGTYQGR